MKHIDAFSFVFVIEPCRAFFLTLSQLLIISGPLFDTVS